MPLAERPAALYALKVRLEDLTRLRREKFEEIKGIERDMAVLVQAMRILDPESYVAKAIRSRKKTHTRRYVLDQLRDQVEPITGTNIANGWIKAANIPDDEREKTIKRTMTCLYHLRAEGIVDKVGLPGRRVGWRLRADAI